MGRKEEICQKVKRLLETNRDCDSILKSSVAILHEACPKYTWTGIYLLEGDQLVLHNYIGKPSPHTKIPLGKGICGAAAAQKETILVSDVNADPRYLACSLETKSEIVVPIINNGKVYGEIDIDSDEPNAFDIEDKELLEAVSSLLGQCFPL